MSLYYGAGSIGSALLVVGACELLPFSEVQTAAVSFEVGDDGAE